MAKLSSSKLAALIRHFVSSPFGAARPPAGDTGAPGSSTIRRFAPPGPISREQIDNAWLERPELGSFEEVTRYLERSHFSQKPGMLTALYVDDRCGLIRSDLVGPAAPRRPQHVVRHMLRNGSDCHAHGIILATFDPSGKLVGSQEWREITRSVCLKGEAIGLVLLNHFVLTAEGWTTTSHGRFPDELPRGRAPVGSAPNYPTQGPSEIERADGSQILEPPRLYDARRAQRRSSNG